MVVMLKSEQDKAAASVAEGYHSKPTNSGQSGLDALSDSWEPMDESAVTSVGNPELIVDDSGRVVSERRVAERRADDGQKHYFDGLTSLLNRQMLPNRWQIFWKSIKAVQFAPLS